MTQDQIIERFISLETWKRGDERAPHKPLLVLYALGQLWQGESWLNCAQHEENLVKLLAEFGPPRRSYRMQYPFVRLVNDGVWQLSGAIDTKADHSAGFLRQEGICGSFADDVLEALEGEPVLAEKISQILLEQNFPDTMHDDILQAVGLERGYSISRRRIRDPEFRERVLQAYEYRCAVCGFDVRLGSKVIALEAAHIKWHQAGGPDIEQNGIAMCTMHHRLFDRGAFTLSDSLEFLVSERAHGTSGLEEWLLRHHGKEIR
jgi:putative restriction endonuclease